MTEKTQQNGYPLAV